MVFTVLRGKMFTFEDVTKIERIRRQIETLQTTLAQQMTITQFRWRNKYTTDWTMAHPTLTPALREAVCKVTVTEILKLLDEASKLGVDTVPGRQALAEALEHVAGDGLPIPTDKS
jgi:hypothetical protein